jgi:hypothetical protein
MAIVTAATPRAARASAFISRGIFSHPERTTPTRPSRTTEEERMSVEKWRASASRAWLSYFFATR